MPSKQTPQSDDQRVMPTLTIVYSRAPNVSIHIALVRHWSVSLVCMQPANKYLYRRTRTPVARPTNKSMLLQRAPTWVPLGSANTSRTLKQWPWSHRLKGSLALLQHKNGSYKKKDLLS